MAEPRPQDPAYQRRVTEPGKGLLEEKGLSKSQVLAVVTLLPVGGVLLLLSGLILAGTLIGLAVATPLFLIFSPILVPAALGLGLAIAGFLTSGAFGITALSSLSWIVNYIRQARLPEQAKRRVQDVGQKVQEPGRT
ncbi:hypothetical protein NMG60_11004486 [Bertholletia excelsa]